MAGSGICEVGRPDARAGTVAAVEARAKAMANGEEQLDQEWLEDKARTVWSVYVSSLVGRLAFFAGNYAKAIEFLQLAAERADEEEKKKLLGEIEEAEAALRGETH